MTSDRARLASMAMDRMTAGWMSGIRMLGRTSADRTLTSRVRFVAAPARTPSAGGCA
jgi:hypothetical protein